ncbi:MAG: 50S ribosomal protein L22 [Chloroflexota bacterium]
MATDYRAIAKNVPLSAQKVRLVVDLVRGKNVSEALDMLHFVQTKPAQPISKLVRSAMINAEENFGISRNDLYIHKIFADVGRTRKWRRFGARGRWKPWLRRSSHITVILRNREEN